MIILTDLPGGETKETTHGEDGEVKDATVGRLVGVSHLLLSTPHVSKVLDDGLTEVLQSLQLHLQRLQLGGVPQVLVVLGLHAVLHVQEYLVATSPHVAGHPRDEANLKYVVLVGGEGELPLRIHLLPVEEVVAAGVRHHQVDLLAGHLSDRVVSRHQDTVPDLLCQTLPEHYH